MFGEISFEAGLKRFGDWAQELHGVGVVVKAGKDGLEFWQNNTVIGAIEKVGENTWNGTLYKDAHGNPVTIGGTFDKVSQGIKEKIKAVVEYGKEKIRNLNAMIVDVNPDSFKEAVKIDNATETIKTLSTWGALPEIAKMYGFVRTQDFENFLQNNWENIREGNNKKPGIKAAINEFSGKKKNPTDELEKQDIFNFFIGPAFFASLPASGIAKGAQWIHEAMSNVVQAVIPVDKIENIYEGLTSRTDNTPQKYIGGRETMRELVKKTRVNNLDTPTNWTFGDVEQLKAAYKGMKRGALIKAWGNSEATDIDGMLNEFLFVHLRGEKEISKLFGKKYSPSFLNLQRTIIKNKYNRLKHKRNKAVLDATNVYLPTQKRQNRRNDADKIASEMKKLEKEETLILAKINIIKKSSPGEATKRDFLMKLDHEFIEFVNRDFFDKSLTGDGFTAQQKTQLTNAYTSMDSRFNKYIK
jgi:hypothetical protein